MKDPMFSAIGNHDNGLRHWRLVTSIRIYRMYQSFYYACQALVKNPSYDWAIDRIEPNQKISVSCIVEAPLTISTAYAYTQPQSSIAEYHIRSAGVHFNMNICDANSSSIFEINFCRALPEAQNIVFPICKIVSTAAYLR